LSNLAKTQDKTRLRKILGWACDYEEP